MPQVYRWPVHAMEEAVNGAWETLHYDIEVFCVVQCGMLCYSASSSLNSDLVNAGSNLLHFPISGDGTPPRSSFLEAQELIMVQWMPGWV